MLLDDGSVEALMHGVEPGMNFISADFDLIVVNRTNERFYGKPVAELLGKKCYREFERREEPCPHCPGSLAMATGEAHETETMGYQPDGTRHFARIRAYPVMGPDNRPTGFIEVVENITAQKRGESLVRIESDLQKALRTAKSIQQALREALDAAMRLEGIGWACIFLVDQATGEHSLSSQRHVSPDWLEPLTAASRGVAAPHPEEIPGAPRVLEVVPILYRDTLVATLLAGASHYPALPAATRAGLHSLGALTGNALSRIWAEQARGDAVADLETVIAATPVATWVLDGEGRVTMWNKAAERLFGWQAAETVGHALPFGPVREGLGPIDLADRDGRPLKIRLLSVPFRDVVGNGSTNVVMAEDVTTTGDATGAAAKPEKKGSAPASAVPGHGKDSDVRDTCVLIVDANQPWGEQLSEVLSKLGYVPVRCGSADEAAAIISGAENGRQPIAVAIVDLMYQDGQSGLDQKAALHSLGLLAPVIVSSDADVHGHKQHGFASVLRRPYSPETADRAVREALRRC